MIGRESGEDSLIAWLRRRLRRESQDLLGDDAALLPASPLGQLATVDTQIEGVHFFPGLDPAQLARRLLAVNLSDLAAMGARPRWALLSLVTPATFDHRRFFRAFLAECRRVGLVLAGGDLAVAPHLQATLTLLGEPQGRTLLRTTAQPGEHVYLGGTVGLSGLGYRLLAFQHQHHHAIWQGAPGWTRRRRRCAHAAIHRHLRPTPQLELGKLLATEYAAGAAIDLSDGLGKDLGRLARASGVEIWIDPDRLPMPADARDLATFCGWSWLELALAGGEDYVLAFTLPAAASPPPGMTCIGQVRSPQKRRVGEPGGEREANGLDPQRNPGDQRPAWVFFADGTPCSAAGFDHLAARPNG